MKTRRRWFRGVFVVCLPVVLAGCAGYTLGPSNGERAGMRSVSVDPAVNTTLEPRFGTAVGNALRQRLQQDGTYRLETATRGDIVVHVEVIEYRRQSIAFKPTDTLTAQEYGLTMTARVIATESATGKRLLDQELHGRTSIVLASDQTSAERQALPLIADDLARNITARLVDGAW